MPYILYSSRQDQLRQDWSASMPPVEVPTFRERLHAKKTISADNKQVAELEPPVIPTKCPWVPPCGAPFGSRAPRFPETKIRCTRQRGNVPPPCTYDPYKEPDKRKLNDLEPWTRAPVVNRSMSTKDGVGPGSYRIMAPIDQELESLAKRTFSFDAFTEPRFAPPKHGYYVRDNANNPPPGSIDVPTLIDLLTFAANRKKGRFLKSVRFPKVYGERCCLSAPGYNIDKEVNAAWGKYNTDLPQAKSCKLKPIKAPFGSHITAKMTQKRYNNSIGIQTPFTGPGRYDPYKFEEKPTLRYSGIAKASERQFDPAKHRLHVERKRAINVPKETGCGRKEVVVRSNIKLR
uniref:Stabilizer of axonemal microtubules 2 n=1 Tax=Mesocestoides corti TaxID=53468 RepID=A0A5K3FDX5_MESCO